MTSFNVLYDSFIRNEAVASQHTLTAEDIVNLLSFSGAVAVSGKNVKLSLDLGFQRATAKLRYAFSPLNLSGVSVQYSRDGVNYTTGSLSLVGNSVEMTPTTSGFTYPRYFTLQHTISGAVTLSGLSVLNDQTDINFGTAGDQTNVSISTTENGGTSQVYEIPVFNNRGVTTDIYAGLDTSNITNDVFERLEIASTATGVFSTFNEGLSIPENPWQWGLFFQTSVEDDKLKIKDPGFNFKVFQIGSTYSLLNTPADNNGNFPIPARMSDSSYVALTTNNNNAVIIKDPIKNTQFIGSNPVTAASTSDERNNHGLAWDGGSRVYYMNNSTDQTVRYYNLATNTHGSLGAFGFYTRAIRRLIFIDDHLYVLGAQSSAGSSSSVGSDFWSINVNTLSGVLIGTTPASLDTETTVGHNGYVYFLNKNGTFARWNVTLSGWQFLTSPPGVTQYKGLSVNTNTDYLYTQDGNNNIYKFNTGSLQWSSSPTGPFTGVNRVCLALDGAAMYGQESSTNTSKIFVLSQTPSPVIDATVSGYWISPVFKVDQLAYYHKILIEPDVSDNGEIKFDNSIGVDNFQIRGSDVSPSADNLVETFSGALSSQVYITGTLNQYTTILSSGNELTFSHNFIDETTTPFNSGFVTYGFPFNTTGKMQYKFFWNPPTDKLTASSHFSAFYIVPFLTTLDTGLSPERATDTLRRNVDDNIYIRFGQNSDSGGTFTRLSFYNGATIANFSINAVTGVTYEVILLVDWSAKTYKLYFDGALVGTGSIPGSRVLLLQSQHTIEFFSGAEIDAEEKFSYLSVSRVGNVAPDLDNIVIPVHKEDPVFGDSGGTWYPVTVNSNLLPKNKYIQLKLTLRGAGTIDHPVVSAIKFPKIVKLTDVVASGTGSVFVRYNFPPSNNFTTNQLFLKSWMNTDKT